MRIAIAFLMMFHGVAHIVGFAGAWRLAKDIPYKTTILAGRYDVGDVGVRVLGLVWLLVAVAFVGIGIAALADRSWWAPAAVVVGASSLALCLVELPAARIGALVNTAIVVALLMAPRVGVQL